MKTDKRQGSPMARTYHRAVPRRATFDEEKERGAIKAQFAGMCSACGGTIFVGDYIEIKPYDGPISGPVQMAVHVRCLPDRVRSDVEGELK
jgi:hypothetical protein